MTAPLTVGDRRRAALERLHGDRAAQPRSDRRLSRVEAVVPAHRRHRRRRARSVAPAHTRPRRGRASARERGANACRRSRGARPADRHLLRDRRGGRRLRDARPRDGAVGLGGDRSEPRQLAVPDLQPAGDVGRPRPRRPRDRGEGAVHTVAPADRAARRCSAWSRCACRSCPGLGASINGASSWIRVGGLSMQPSEFLKLAVVVLAADLLARRPDDVVDARRAIVPITLARRDRRGAVPRPGRPRLGGRAGGHRVLGRLDRRCADHPPRHRVRRRRRRRAAVRRVEPPSSRPLHVVHQRRRGEGPPRLPDLPGLPEHRLGRAHRLGHRRRQGQARLPAVRAERLHLRRDRRRARVRRHGGRSIGGFIMLVAFGIQTALAAPDRFGMLLAGGIATWFGVQAIVNLGGVVGRLPVTGLTLPFFSAGGSSLFVSMTAAGLLLSVAAPSRPVVTARDGAGPAASPSSPAGAPPVTCCRRSPSPTRWWPPVTTRRRSATSGRNAGSRRGCCPTRRTRTRSSTSSGSNAGSIGGTSAFVPKMIVGHPVDDQGDARRPARGGRVGRGLRQHAVGVRRRAARHPDRRRLVRPHARARQPAGRAAGRGIARWRSRVHRSRVPR